MSEKPVETLSDLRLALRFWELGRWVYNSILLALGLLWSWNLRKTMIDQALLGYWGSVAAFGATANVFYTLGPAAESYVRVFFGKSWGATVRWGLWLAGTATAAALTWSFVWSMEILYIVLYPHSR
jgi:hypothetical protein